MYKKVILSLCRFKTPKLHEKGPSAISWRRLQPKLFLRERPSAHRSTTPTVGSSSPSNFRIVLNLEVSIVVDAKIVRVFKARESGDASVAEVVGGGMEECDVGELVDEALQLRCTQTEAIENYCRHCELLSSAGRCCTVEADVALLAADVVAGPRAGDVLGIRSDRALEALNGVVSAVEPIVWKIFWS
jgi:hypothetical protein